MLALKAVCVELNAAFMPCEMEAMLAANRERFLTLIGRDSVSKLSVSLL